MTMNHNVILEVNCEDIDWELFDCEDCERLLIKEKRLPNNITIYLQDKISYFKKIDRQELEDLISDKISKKYIFLHNGFTIKSIRLKTRYPTAPTEVNEIIDLKKNIETKLNLRGQFKSTVSLEHLLK